MKRTLALTLAVMLVACTQSKSTDTQPKDEGERPAPNTNFHVIFDLSKEQIYSPFDAYFAGMSQLTDALRDEGALVSVNFRDLTSLTRNVSGPGNILVLGPALERKYEPEDLEAIRGFRKSGGGVLVIAEHDNFFRHADMHNALTEAWGIKIRATTADGKGRRLDEIQWPFSHSNRLGVQNVRPMTAAPLKLSKDAQPLLKVDQPFRASTDVVAALSETAGLGPVAVVADAEMFWNMSRPTGMSLGNNKDFVLKLFRLLAGRQIDQAGQPRPLKSVIHETGAQGTVFIETGSGGLRADGSLSGLDRLADVLNEVGYGVEQGVLSGDPTRYKAVVVAAPLRNAKNLELLKKVPRLVLLAEGSSDPMTDMMKDFDMMLQVMPKEVVAQIRKTLDEKVKYDPKDYPSTLNDLGLDRGIAFGQTMVAAEGGNRQIGLANIPNNSYSYYRAAPIQLLSEQKKLTVVGSTYPGAWVCLNPTPPTGTPGKKAFGQGNQVVKLRTPFPKTEGLPQGEIPILVTGPGVFASGDADLLGNAHADREGKPVVDRLITWLGQQG
ncbi:MAG: hypothetical protein CMH55_05445 [Myxococcales bacterium]|nr:hypothetical protein [Myxococcales bacterium]